MPSTAAVIFWPPEAYCRCMDGGNGLAGDIRWSLELFPERRLCQARISCLPTWIVGRRLSPHPSQPCPSSLSLNMTPFPHLEFRKEFRKELELAMSTNDRKRPRRSKLESLPSASPKETMPSRTHSVWSRYRVVYFLCTYWTKKDKLLTGGNCLNFRLLPN